MEFLCLLPARLSDPLALATSLLIMRLLADMRRLRELPRRRLVVQPHPERIDRRLAALAVLRVVLERMSRVPRASTVAHEHAEALSLPVEILAVDPSAGDARMRRITRRLVVAEGLRVLECGDDGLKIGIECHVRMKIGE
jgi:hypothetical protein